MAGVSPSQPSPRGDCPTAAGEMFPAAVGMVSPRCDQKFFKLGGHVSSANGTLLSLLPVVATLAWWLWATAGATAETRHIPPTILPSPSEVFHSMAPLWNDGSLGRNVVVSLLRVTGGFSIAALLAIPLGLTMGSFGRVNATFSLVATVLSYIPLPALIPLSMAWWGIGEKQKVCFLTLVAFSYLLPLVVRHVKSIDHKFVLSAQSQGATPWQIVTKILLPMAMPDIFSAMRLGMGVGWTYIILVEVIKNGDGIGGVGSLIMVYHRLGHMPEVYLTVATILVVGVVIDKSFLWFGNQLFPWRQPECD